MSVIRAARVGFAGLRISPVCTRLVLSVRFNSTQPKNTESQQITNTPKIEDKIGLTAKLFPANKSSITEDDVDSWLEAVEELKKGKHVAETDAEVYLQQLTNPKPFLEEEDAFTPTAKQLKEAAAYADTKIPIVEDPLVENFVNLIMRHGRKATARKTVSRALYMVYLQTRRDPLEVLRETVEKLAPLIDTTTQQTGTAKNKVVPYPLDRRQRNRYAFTWIIDGSAKKKSKSFSVRLAEEIVSAHEGNSSGYDRRAQMHKLAIAQRAYVRF